MSDGFLCAYMMLYNRPVSEIFEDIDGKAGMASKNRYRYHKGGGRFLM